MVQQSATKRKQVRYTRLAEDFEEEKLDAAPTFIQATSKESQNHAQQKGLLKHEIYENTYYIPNSKVRVLETPMSSSLSFQMLRYYHFFFNLLYLGTIFTTIIYKLWIFWPNIVDILALIIGIFVWFPVELARLNFGYKGNINETVSENELVISYSSPN